MREKDQKWCETLAKLMVMYRRPFPMEFAIMFDKQIKKKKKERLKEKK